MRARGYAASHAQAKTAAHKNAPKRTKDGPPDLVYCPYTIAVYTRAGKPGVVYLAHRKYPETAALNPVAGLIDGIVADASK